MDSIIAAKDLNLWYGASQALKNINMQIAEKETDRPFRLWKIHLFENAKPDE